MREKLLRVLVADLGQILCRELPVQRLEPVARVFELLVGVVDREEDAVNANLVLHVLERQRREVARGGNPDVLVEVVTNRLFHRNGASRLVDCRSAREKRIAEASVSRLHEKKLLSCGGSLQQLTIFKPVVDAPQVKWDVLAQVSHDDLELRVAVKDAIDNHAEEVGRDVVSEGENRTDQSGAVLVDAR